ETNCRQLTLGALRKSQLASDRDRFAVLVAGQELLIRQGERFVARTSVRAAKSFGLGSAAAHGAHARPRINQPARNMRVIDPSVSFVCKNANWPRSPICYRPTS